MKKEEEKLLSFLQSSIHDNGFPVLISMCLTRNEVSARFPTITAKVMSAELFSIFASEGQKLPNLHIDLDQFFSATQKIIFYTQNSNKTLNELQGKYKPSNY
jgi:hypothetical protein